jgi:hypothetical protein
MHEPACIKQPPIQSPPGLKGANVPIIDIALLRTMTPSERIIAYLTAKAAVLNELSPLVQFTLFTASEASF